MSYQEKINDIYQKIFTGQMMEAFEQYYAPNVVMIEATGEVREGKDKNREFEVQFMQSVKEVHGGGVNALASNEQDGVTLVESWMDVTFQDGNRIKMEQIARQKWEGDQIVEERFYYNPGPMMGGN